MTVQCPVCDTIRPVVINSQMAYWRAIERLCFPCAFALRYDDVDHMAVERLISGSRITATPAERRAAVAHLTRAGRSARVIAARIGCTKRTVERHRATLAAQ